MRSPLFPALILSLTAHAALLSSGCSVLSCGTAYAPAAPWAFTAQLVQARETSSAKERAAADVRVEAKPSSPASAEPPADSGKTDNAEAESGPLALPLASLYHSVRELSRHPQIDKALDLDTPALDSYLEPGHLTASVFIDERGVVDFILIDATDLPPVFAERVKRSFSGVRFVPGELDGRPVKSRIRIEVSFDPDR